MIGYHVFDRYFLGAITSQSCLAQPLAKITETSVMLADTQHSDKQAVPLLSCYNGPLPSSIAPSPRTTITVFYSIQRTLASIISAPLSDSASVR
jgi:hypothetical protein